MKAIGNILVTLSGLTSQVPVFMLFKDDTFIPPFENGRPLFFIALEVLCTTIFAMVLLNKAKIIKYSAKRFNKMVGALVVVIMFVGLVYSMLFMSYVFEDANGKVVIPIVKEEKLKEYLSSPATVDSATLTDFINHFPFNKTGWLFTYVTFFLCFAIFFGSIVILYAIIGTRLSEKEKVGDMQKQEKQEEAAMV
ncbi:MAG TPA: hypothetical protein VGD31_12395 [Sphingobacteriaceae bacterium]